MMVQEYLTVKCIFFASLIKHSCFSGLKTVGHPVNFVVSRRERDCEGQFNETLTVHFPLSDENDEKTDINRLSTTVPRA